MIEKIRASSITLACTIEHKSPRRNQMQNRSAYGISLALDGEIVYHHKGKSYVSTSDNVIILPMGADYYYDCTRSGSFLLINFLPAGDFSFDTFYSIGISDRERYQRLHKIIEHAFRTDDIGREARMLSALYDIISMLCEQEAQRSTPFSVSEAQRYIESNLSNPSLSNAEIASHVDISEVYLRKLFSKYLGVAPKQYIQSMRINLAKQILSKCDISITEVSEECGYSDVYTFCHAFRRLCGETPKKYREKMKSI